MKLQNENSDIQNSDKDDTQFQDRYSSSVYDLMGDRMEWNKQLVFAQKYRRKEVYEQLKKIQERYWESCVSKKEWK